MLREEAEGLVLHRTQLAEQRGVVSSHADSRSDAIIRGVTGSRSTATRPDTGWTDDQTRPLQAFLVELRHQRGAGTPKSRR